MSNPYPQRFLDLLTSDSYALDCGAGGRKMESVVSLEIEPHPHNDVQASGLDLPFCDESFDVILSQAVLEHVTDPQCYVDECWRVLKRQGLLYIEAAFMQPVHQAPIHFFNFTPFGLALMCKQFSIEGQGAIGDLPTWWEWFSREAGIEQRLKPVTQTEAQIWNTSSGVWLLGRKT